MTPEFARFKAQFGAAIPQGLTAAVGLYQGAIREKLQRGYTTGKYVTSYVASSVQIGPVERDSDGPSVTIGTNVMYALYWELGHVNVFTRRYERVEHWHNTIVEQGDAMALAFGTEVQIILDGGEGFIGPRADPSYKWGAP